jgi:phage terminase large subunit GpA-like protein
MISVPKKPGSADEARKLWLRVTQLVTKVYTRPSDLNGVEWADTYRHVAGGASPGKWKTSTQPIAAGPMVACTDPKISVVALMMHTQGIKTESLITAAMYFISQDPSDILWVFPTQDFAGKFSKGRFARNVAVTPVIHELISHPKYRQRKVSLASVKRTLILIGASAF